MKTIPLIFIVIALLAGCAPTQYRTGSVVVEKFSIDGYKTSNPVDIRKDVAEFVRDGLQREILGTLKEESKLTIADNCDQGTYRLVGRIKEINSEIDSHYRFVTVTVNQKFEVDVEGELQRCDTGKQVLEFSESNKDEKMDEALEGIAEDIVKNIRKEPASVPSTTVKALDLKN